MNPTAGRLERILAATPQRLAGIAEEGASELPADGGWSKKQILGHLIDSASNNHQRFVRAQLAASYEGPNYDQERWVSVQAYAMESWPDLVSLWLLYNRHLLHIMRATPDEALAAPCLVGGLAAVALSEVMSGYVDHMAHHLAQILG